MRLSKDLVQLLCEKINQKEREKQTERKILLMGKPPVSKFVADLKSFLKKKQVEAKKVNPNIDVEIVIDDVYNRVNATRFAKATTPGQIYEQLRDFLPRLFPDLFKNEPLSHWRDYELEVHEVAADCENLAKVKERLGLSS